MLLAVSAFTHVLKGLDIEEAVVALGVAVLLLRSSSLFEAPTPPHRWRTAIVMVVTIIPVAFVYGVVGFAVRHDRVRPEFTFVGAVQETAARLVGLSGPLAATGGFGHWFPASITVLGFVALIAIAVAVLAPVTEGTVAPAIERERIRRLANREDGDTLDPFALRHDKRYITSADGRAAVAYRYVNGAGTRVRRPRRRSRLLRRRHRTVPRSVPSLRLAARGDRARADRIPFYEAAGLRARYLGDEAVIDVDEFTLDGRRMRPVRQAFNRTKNFALTAEIHREGELDPTLRRARRHLGPPPRRRPLSAASPWRSTGC